MMAQLEIPLGGAKGGITCEPKKLSEIELEKLTRKYTRAISLDIGPNQDIPAPDVNTNERVMAWIMDEYSKLHGYNPAVVTGKPAVLGGSPGRIDASGRGVAIIVKQWAEDHNLPMGSSKAAIQGFGNVGYYAAYHLERMGCRIVAVSDTGAAVFNENGLDIKKLQMHEKVTGSVADFTDAETTSKEEVFSIECDFFIPAALENAADDKVSLRMAAYMLSIDKVARAALQRGAY